MPESAKTLGLPKRFLAAGCLLCMVFALCANCMAREGGGPSQLRYFMQPPHVEGSATPYGNNTAAGHYVQAADAKIWYEVYGAGSLIFVFHGGGLGCSYELGGLIDELRKQHKVVVVSSRGHGRSEIGHGPMSLRQKAEDMLAVMEKVTDRPAALLGFSDGAYTALEVAALKPQAVERVVAIGAGTLERGFFPDKLPLVGLEKLDKAYVAQMRALAPEPGRLGQFLNDYMRMWHNTQVGKELFGAIRCPVLLVVGDGDTHAPVGTVLAAKDMAAHARLCVVPHAGHAAFLDNYPVAWAAISQFLNAPLQELEGGAEKAKQ
ncbi:MULTISPECIES: alpha/beta hydrolase [unclassified Desulfovibrio]|uniref:alpha/beta fold hydrolase n=1 Tax=unclassified Desulfovibrio TaxID=2593640 RepID=UPI0013EE1627|nr:MULTISPECIES: alpha/beta hydrolase [unclassified Desulfovibrio]